MTAFSKIISPIISFSSSYFPSVIPLLLVSQLGFFSLFIINGRNATIDCGWVFNHFLVGLFLSTNRFKDFTLLLNSPKNLISIGILGLWLLRLGGHLFFNRVWKEHTDSRYTAMMRKAEGFGKVAKYFVQYMLQGVLASISSIPLYFVFSGNAAIGVAQYIGWGMSLIGIVGQGIADNQLEKFKRSKKEPGSLLREGLWRKSRHPNLFFELVTWFGISLCGISKLSDIVALVGPCFLWFVMSGLTIPITEKCMKRSRQDVWGKYISETNKYWPF